jgi:hypothetical protein
MARWSEGGWMNSGWRKRQEKVYNREEWNKLLRTASNRRILRMPIEWMNESIWNNSYKDSDASVLRHRYPRRSVIGVSKHSDTFALKVVVHYQLHHEDGGRKLIHNTI